MCALLRSVELLEDVCAIWRSFHGIVLLHSQTALALPINFYLKGNWEKWGSALDFAGWLLDSLLTNISTWLGKFKKQSLKGVSCAQNCFSLTPGKCPGNHPLQSNVTWFALEIMFLKNNRETTCFFGFLSDEN